MQFKVSYLQDWLEHSLKKSRSLTYIRPMLQSYRNQAIDLQCKSSDWFLYVQCNIGLTWVKDQHTREISVFELFHDGRLYHTATSHWCTEQINGLVSVWLGTPSWKSLWKKSIQLKISWKPRQAYLTYTTRETTEGLHRRVGASKAIQGVTNLVRRKMLTANLQSKQSPSDGENGTEGMVQDLTLLLDVLHDLTT